MNSNLINRSLLVLVIALSLGLVSSTSIVTVSYLLITFIVSIYFAISLKNKTIGISIFKDKILIAYSIFLVFMLSSLFFYSKVDFTQKKQFLAHISEYYLIYFIYLAISIKNNSKFFIKTFMYCTALSAILSIGAFLFNHPILMGAKDIPHIWSTFREHLTHTIFLALGSVFLLSESLDLNNSKNKRILFFTLYLFTFIDSMFLVQGRTGEIMFLFMSVIYIIIHYGKKGFLISTAAIIVVLPILYFSSPVIKSGIKAYQDDQIRYEQGDLAQNSMGDRKVFHKISKIAFMQKPIMGYGAASFADTYESIAKRLKINMLTVNPHSDMYYILVQFGIIGLGFYLLILYSIIKEAFTLTTKYKNLLLTFVGGYLLGGLQNTLLFDGVTGWTFVCVMLAIVIHGRQKKLT